MGLYTYRRSVTHHQVFPRPVNYVTTGTDPNDITIRDDFPAHQKLSTHPCSSLPMTAQVDYTGFSTINAQRFGQKFVGKVANPHDILLWHKAPVRKAKVLHDPIVCFASFPFLNIISASRWCWEPEHICVA